jgi:hypothetical protein
MPKSDPFAEILHEARAHVASGRDPHELEARIRAAGESARARDGAVAADLDRAEQRALQQLERVVAVHRARARIANPPSAPPPRAPLPPRRAAIRPRPTIGGNMEVRRQAAGDTVTFSWDAAKAVAGWEVRFSERADARADYVVRDTLTLPPDTTSIEVPLGEHPLRVHLLGRSRDGRLLRRAIVSALTRENWNDRWQRRASAS